MLKNSENNRTEKIGLVTPTLEQLGTGRDDLNAVISGIANSTGKMCLNCDLIFSHQLMNVFIHFIISVSFIKSMKHALY